MKTKIYFLLLFVLIAWLIPGCYVVPSNQYNGTQYSPPPPEYNVDDLNQYGDWVNVNTYGRVWRPSVVDNWQPFTNGHWDYDGNDWVWVSYEPFGWIVCHYGSWDYSPDNGWFWIPDNDEWSPASVQWIDYGDNVGWAPRRPHNNNWAEPWENNNVQPWTVVKMRDFNREDITSYRVPSVTRDGNLNQTQIQRRQPDVKTIQRYVKDPIGVVKFEREPVVTQSPPVRTNLPPERNAPPDRNPRPPDRNASPEVNAPPERINPPHDRTPLPPERINPPQDRTNNPPERINTPQGSNRNNISFQPPGNRRLIRLQVPPAEKQKVDKYRPKVEKDKLIKKKPRTQE